MSIAKLKKQLRVLDALDKHEAQINNMFAGIYQRRTQLANQRATMTANGTFDAEDLQLVDDLIAYIDARYTHIS